MKQGVFTVKVAKKQQAAVDIVTFELVDPAGESLPNFTAGAHVDVHVGDGLVRQYSLCNDPQETHRYQIGVLRDPASRGGSIAMHDNINEGDSLQISEPRNHFTLAHDAKESVLFAGGIGITPILCMAERLANIGSPFTLHYCTRSQDRMAFRERIQSSPFAGQVHFYFDDSPDSEKLNIQTALGSVDPGRHIYVCGPTGFLEFVRASAKEAGWSDDNVHYEYFGAEVQTSASSDSFQVKVASTGAVFTVNPGETIVEVLEKNGIEVLVSCQQGICGTCLTHVLEGTPEHLDYFLSDEEREANDQMTVCCSRSKSNMLVLDL